MKIISIGPSCVAAELLKYNNSRTESYPFDWARSNILSVINVLKNGHDFYIKYNIETKNSKIYWKKHFEIIYYPHHDYKNKDYFIRCSNRLFNILNSDQEVKFLYMSDDEVKSDIGPVNREIMILDNELELLIKILDENYPKLKYEIIMIYNIKDCKENIKLKTQTSKYRIYHCNSPKRFMSNSMKDSYSKEIFKFVFN